MEPALTALLRRPAVPGDAQGLQPSARQLEQVLLQRIDAEGVLDRIVAQRAVRPVGAHHEPGAITVETAAHAAEGHLDVGEVAQHRPLGRHLHRAVVVRAAPGGMLGGVALGAGAATHVTLVDLGRAYPAHAEQRCQHDDDSGGSGLEHLVAGQSRNWASAEHRESSARRPMTTGPRASSPGGERTALEAEPYAQQRAAEREILEQATVLLVVGQVTVVELDVTPGAVPHKATRHLPGEI